MGMSGTGKANQIIQILLVEIQSASATFGNQFDSPLWKEQAIMT